MTIAELFGEQDVCYARDNVVYFGLSHILKNIDFVVREYDKTILCYEDMSLRFLLSRLDDETTKIRIKLM